ncbi:thermonuclease family protein [Maridesulfovibrio zosterae]|uniref:thermonuclease family protein n=1 Tax=Maridesulfovibrio zosterae TaxID=82171 RepID=UPI001FDEBD8E|nr:thermonuclease family protein [Maridesulfovibrio zosterae]
MKHVIDGDTFVLWNNKTVRIASVDTPEIGYEGHSDQYYAREAKEILTKLILGKSVQIEYTPDHKDHYNRIVGWVYVNGIFVNEYLVKNGAAFFYYHKNNQEKYQNILLEAQRKAYEDKSGFWPVIQRVKEFNSNWIGNSRSQRCFPEGNKYALRTAKRNRIYFSNLGKAFLEGYSPARNINFWPEVK